MGILNLEFAKLIVTLAICVLPGVFGIYLIATGEETKRRIRRAVCNQLFGMPNAFTYKGFARFMVIVGVILILISLALTWLLVLSGLLSGAE